MEQKSESVSLQLKHLTSYISFSEWLSKNVSHFKDNKPSKTEMLIYLNFIKNKTYGAKLLNKKEFLVQIKRLIKRLRTKDD